MKITYNDLDGSAPVAAPLDGALRLFDGVTKTVPEDMESFVRAKLKNNPWFTIEDDATEAELVIDEKTALIAEIERLGGKAKKSQSVETLKGILEGLTVNA